MGCDIHAMIEARGKYGWVNRGDPEIDRYYALFAVLAGVRSGSDSPEPISDPKGCPPDASSEFEAWLDSWDTDAHSTSWLTLKEMKTAEKDILQDLVEKLEKAKLEGGSDEDVRLCFFFDN